MKNCKFINKMALFLTLAMCIQRLSMALGNVFFSFTIILFFFYLYQGYKTKTLVVDEEIMDYYRIIAFFVLTVVPSVIFSSNFLLSLKTFSEMWIYRVIPFFVVTLFLKDKDLLMKMLLVFLAVTGIDSLVALAQVVMGLAGRGWGFGGNTLNLAAILCMTTPITIVILGDNQFSKIAKKVALAALVCYVIGALAGQSRGAWVALAVILPLVSYRYLLQNKKILTLVIVFVLAIAVFISQSARFTERVSSITNVTTDRSNADRLVMWESSWNMMKDHAAFGVGAGNFKQFYKEQYKLPEMTQAHLNHAHNNFMQIGAETGFVGLIGWTILSFYILLKNFWDWYKNNDPYALMIWSSWAGFMLFGMIDLIVDASAVIKSWWFLLGILLVLKSYNKKTSDI